MARITISLPDNLEAQLNQYADQQKMHASTVVQVALEKFFAPAPAPPPQAPTPPQPAPPPPAPSDADQAARIQRLEDYIVRLAYKTEYMREGLWSVSSFMGQTMGYSIPCPREIPQPTWPHQPPPGWNTGDPG